MTDVQKPLPRAVLPPYENPPPWIPREQRLSNKNYNNDLRTFLPRSVKLVRKKPSDQLGFNIRGGKEHSSGIYISKVLPNTDAQRIGLQEGDQILQVNGVSFDIMEHAEAVRILKRNAEIQMFVKYFPFGYEKTYIKTRMPSPVASFPS